MLEIQTDPLVPVSYTHLESRYTRLIKPFPERAERLFNESEKVAKERYEHLQKLVELYK